MQPIEFCGKYKTYLYLTRLQVARSVHEKSTEKAQLNAMSKSFYLRFIKFPMEHTLTRTFFMRRNSDYSNTVCFVEEDSFKKQFNLPLESNVASATSLTEEMF